LTLWASSSPSERLSALGTHSQSRVAAAAQVGPPLMGFTLESAPPSIYLTRPLPDRIAAILRQPVAKQVVLFRPCGFSPLRRFTPRSVTSLFRLEPDRGSPPHAPKPLTEVVASGRLATLHPRKNLPPVRPHCCEKQPLDRGFQQPDTKASRNNAHTSPPSEKGGSRSRVRSSYGHPRAAAGCATAWRAFGRSRSYPNASVWVFSTTRVQVFLRQHRGAAEGTSGPPTPASVEPGKPRS